MLPIHGKNKNLNLFITLGIILIFLVSGVFLFYFTEVSEDENRVISSYEECAAAGNPILESYPPQCKTEDGQTFSQETNEIDLSSEIQMVNPIPNQLIEKTLDVSGQASGSWLFEGQTSMKLYDTDNNLVAEGIVTAQSDWMTENLVPFTGVLNFVQPDPQKGKLVIEKSNPSGLEANKKELVVPIYFK